MAINLQSLVEQGANVKIEITAADLKMFGEGIAERAIMAYRQEIESKKPQEETYCNTREVKNSSTYVTAHSTFGKSVAISYPSRSGTRICMP